jgi:hypothetical protein
VDELKRFASEEGKEIIVATAQALAANLRAELTERINCTLSHEVSNYLDDETLCVFAKKNLTEDSDQAFFNRVVAAFRQRQQPAAPPPRDKQKTL